MTRLLAVNQMSADTGTSTRKFRNIMSSRLSIRIHIQPARVLGRVVELHTAQEFLGSVYAQYVVEALSEVGVEVVEHQVNSTRLGIRASEQPIDEGDEITIFPRRSVTETTR